MRLYDLLLTLGKDEEVTVTRTDQDVELILHQHPVENYITWKDDVNLLNISDLTCETWIKVGDHI